MPTVLQEIARAIFGVSLAVGMLNTALFCKIISLIPGLKKSYREGLPLMVVQFAWRVSLWLSPWIWITAAPRVAAQWKQFSQDMLKDDSKPVAFRQPAFVISNHTSFLDTILTVCVMPASVAWRTRTYMGAHLFQMPILSTICKALGHFPVYFTGSKYGEFSVDRAKMDEVQRRVDAHLEHGGVLAFFPEGQMNKTPDSLCDFRYGGFKKALSADARVWAIVEYGNQTCWPIKAPLGGFPTTGCYDLQPLAPQGCRGLVAKLRKEIGKEENASMSDEQILALHCREEMQKMYDNLKAHCLEGKPLKAA